MATTTGIFPSQNDTIPSRTNGPAFRIFRLPAVECPPVAGGNIYVFGGEGEHGTFSANRSVRSGARGLAVDGTYADQPAWSRLRSRTRTHLSSQRRPHSWRFIQRCERSLYPAAGKKVGPLSVRPEANPLAHNLPLHPDCFCGGPGFRFLYPALTSLHFASPLPARLFFGFTTQWLLVGEKPILLAFSRSYNRLQRGKQNPSST